MCVKETEPGQRTVKRDTSPRRPTREEIKAETHVSSTSASPSSTPSSSSSPSSSVHGHLLELTRNLGLGLLQDTNELPSGLGVVSGCEKKRRSVSRFRRSSWIERERTEVGVRSSGSSGSTSSSNSERKRKRQGQLARSIRGGRSPEGIRAGKGKTYR